MTPVAALELGGTKALLTIGSGPEDLLPPMLIPTTTPDETLGRVVDQLRSWRDAGHGFKALGVGGFGPLQGSADGFTGVALTPKPGWSGQPLTSSLAEALSVPVVLDTDVTAAALGEGRWGAGLGLADFAYVTVGTGIGAGLIVGGRPVRGMIHPEIGHLLVRRDAGADPFDGVCPFHGDCLEGLTCGPALEQRVGRPAATLDADHPVWAFVVDYLGQLCAALALAVSPQRIIIGGGVGARPELHPRIAAAMMDRLGGYLRHPRLAEPAGYVVPPGLGDRSGLLGAMALAQGLQ